MLYIASPQINVSVSVQRNADEWLSDTLERAELEAVAEYRRRTGSRRKVYIQCLVPESYGGTSAVYRGTLIGAYSKKQGGAPIIGTAYVTVYQEGE